MPAKYNLEEVKRLITEFLDNPAKGKVVFSAPSKSYQAVIREFGGLKKHNTNQKAMSYIANRFLELTPSHFIRSEVGQWQDPTFITDHYGAVFDGVPWFIKFRIDPTTGELDEISFHRTDREMQLEDGRVIRLNGSIYG